MLFIMLWLRAIWRIYRVNPQYSVDRAFLTAYVPRRQQIRVKSFGHKSVQWGSYSYMTNAFGIHDRYNNNLQRRDIGLATNMNPIISCTLDLFRDVLIRRVPCFVRLRRRSRCKTTCRGGLVPFLFHSIFSIRKYDFA